MQSIRNYILQELFIDAPQAQTDDDILRLSIIAELDAISLYKKFANQTTNEVIRKTLLEIAEEEEVHVGELETLLKQINPEYTNNLEKGKDEVSYPRL